MKKSRTLLIAAIAIGLLAASTIGVSAQDETEGVEPTSVTGSTVGYRQVSPGTVTSIDGIERTSGVVSTNRWSTSDARLSGDVTYNGNWYHSADPELSIQSGTYEVTNDGGTWLGEATAYGIQTLGIDMDTVILTGQDGYDGLTAYVVLDFGSGAGAISGVIFPTAMPPVPEPRESE